MTRISIALCALLLLGADSFVVVVDPGHGGEDHGARGSSGVLEKHVVLETSRELGRALRDLGIDVVLTRSDDSFVSLSRRADVANRVRGDLFLSIHANSAPDPKAAGTEIFFLSLQASDEEAQRVAIAENSVYDAPAAAPDSGDIVGAILGDLIRTDYLRASSQLAGAIQHRLAGASSATRGVKQAPFVVLMDVNMPAALVELGFLTHAGEESLLRSHRYRVRLARAIAAAVSDYRAGRAEAAKEETPE